MTEGEEADAAGPAVGRRPVLGAMLGSVLPLGNALGRPPQDAEGSKPQFQGDPANTGYVPAECPPTTGVNRTWRVSPPELHTTDVSLVTTSTADVSFDSTVFAVGRQNGAILAVDPGDGTVGWKWQPDGFEGELTTPTASDGVLYCGAGEPWSDGRDGVHGTVYAVDVLDDELAWETGVGRGPAHVTGTGESVYVGSTGALYALDPDDGSAAWSATPDDTDATIGYPAVADGTVVYATDAGGVYAVDAANGDRQWSADVGGPAHVSVADGTVYVGSEGTPSVRALDLADGSERWRFAGDGPVTHPPAVAAGRVFTFVREGGDAEGAGVLSALSAADGARLWEFRTPGVYVGPLPPLVSGDAVLAVGNPHPDTYDNDVYVVDATSGDLRGQVDIAVDEGTAAPVVLGDTLFVADNSVGTGYLSAYAGETQCGSLSPPDGASGSEGGDDSTTETHTLTISANGPTEYTVTVDGSLEPDTGDGRSAGESGDAPTENDDGTLTASDLTGPTAEDAGGSTYYGDRFRFSGSIEELTLDPAPSADDVTVLIDGETVTREEALAFEG